MRKTSMHSPPIYQEDLSAIHIEGYGFHWEQAAPTVLAFLKQHGISRGTIVDLGCGGGQWLARLAEMGYDVCGIDQSERMIRAARALRRRRLAAL
jgi:2-polyprenyl-3-methyl-5-hydroxy-6-metoxy-1,4-benzoquinol methylase